MHIKRYRFHFLNFTSKTTHQAKGTFCKYSNCDILKELSCVTFIHLIILIPLLLLKGPSTYLRVVDTELFNYPILLDGKFQVLQKKFIYFMVLRCQCEFLGTFATLQKVTNCFIIFVCLHMMT